MAQQTEKQAERRKIIRFSINEEVYDQKTGKSLGYTADLNAYGMMLVSTDQCKTGEETRISINIPDGKNKKIKTFLTAQCRWSERHLNTAFFNSGFRFIYSSNFDIEFIETLFFGLIEQ